jgi:dienelactone hydrolase
VVTVVEQARTLATVPRWFGPPGRPLLGWLSAPTEPVGATGVVVLPPVGYDYWSTHRTLRATAERLAGAGYAALRIDYDGTGDSAGDQTDPDRLARWRGSAAAAVAELRSLGAERIVLLGMRIGATIALLDGAELGADAVIAWAPVVAGRRYVKEIRMLAGEAPAAADSLPQGTLLAAGCVYRPDTLADLAAIDLVSIANPPAPRVLIVAAAPDERLIARLRAIGVEVTAASPTDCERPLELPAEYATVPEPALDEIAGWLGAAEPGTPIDRSPAASARISTPGAIDLTEQVLALGDARLVAIETTPAAPAPGAPTLLLLNTGSEPHIGPGRAWVEYARALAAEGYVCVRADFRGWGESPDGGHAPGRPYDAHCVDDALELIRALRERAGGPIVVGGLCASAWVALRAVLLEPVGGVVALNPQLYWRPGDPVEATMAETRQQRTAEREREALGGRLGVWTLLDLFGSRPWAGRWLDELAATGVPVTLAFGDGDDGIEFLRNRVDRRLRRVLRSAPIEVVEIPDIDHSMGRVWLRERVIAVLRERLAASASDVAGRARQSSAGR